MTSYKGINAVDSHIGRIKQIRVEFFLILDFKTPQDPEIE